jgi:hypothetical protein
MKAGSGMYYMRRTTVFSFIFCFVFANLSTAEENASNPLASVNNIDLRSQYTSEDAGDRYNTFIDAAYMITPKLKLKYELHYEFTDVTGSDESDFEKVVLKPIYFPSQTKLNNDWGLKTAVGLDWTLDFNNEDKGIGTGSDTIAPFGGLAFNHFKSGLVAIPLVQQFVSYEGDTDINTTSLRLIALLPFGEGYWGKLDLKLPYDWENEAWPVTSEMQVGYNFNKSWAIYADALVGLGNDRPYDGGVGLGIRFKY